MLLKLNVLTQMLEAGFVKTLPLFQELHDAKKIMFLKVPLKRKFRISDSCLIIEFAPYLDTIPTFFFAYGNRILPSQRGQNSVVTSLVVLLS